MGSGAFAELTYGPSGPEIGVSNGTADSIFRHILFLLRARAEVAAMSQKAVLASFDSLGDNCEFGMVQRACGVQALGLLSFARTPPDVLADILENRLEGVDDPDALRLATRNVEGGIEHILCNDRLGIVYHIAEHHSFVKDPHDLLQSETARLKVLAHELLERLESGSRIFVVKCNEDLTQDEARLILDKLTRYGPNTLLYVVTADHAHEEGRVVALAPNLYRGYINSFAPYHNAYRRGAVATWATICRNTLLLRGAKRLSAGAY